MIPIPINITPLVINFLKKKAGIIQLCSLVGASFSFFLGSLLNNAEGLSFINMVHLSFLNKKVISIPLLLMSGFFAYENSFAPYMIPLEYLSYFKWSFQVLVYLEYKDIQPFYCVFNLQTPCDDVLGSFYRFKEDFWVSFSCLIGIIFALNFFAYMIFFIKSKLK